MSKEKGNQRLIVYWKDENTRTFHSTPKQDGYNENYFKNRMIEKIIHKPAYAGKYKCCLLCCSISGKKLAKWNSRGEEVDV